jgi:hypothetical protein
VPEPLRQDERPQPDVRPEDELGENDREAPRWSQGPESFDPTSRGDEDGEVM